MADRAIMPSPKDHHFVPQHLLREFADGEGWLHWSKVASPDAQVRKARPWALFFKKHLYSTIDKNGVRDARLERELGALESEAAPLIGRMIGAARADRLPLLSPRDTGVWYSYFLTQWRRAPETQRAVATDEEAMAMLDETLAEARRRFPNRGAEVDALATPEARRRILRNVRVDGIRYLSNEVTGVLSRRGIAILRIRKPNKTFVIGSRPVVKLTTPGRTDLRDPAVEMWLPVASDIAIGVGAGDRGVRLLYLDAGPPVRQLNVAIARQSSVIAAASPELVASLARTVIPIAG